MILPIVEAEAVPQAETLQEIAATEGHGITQRAEAVGANSGGPVPMGFARGEPSPKLEEVHPGARPRLQPHRVSVGQEPFAPQRLVERGQRAAERGAAVRLVRLGPEQADEGLAALAGLGENKIGQERDRLGGVHHHRRAVAFDPRGAQQVKPCTGHRVFLKTTITQIGLNVKTSFSVTHFVTVAVTLSERGGATLRTITPADFKSRIGGKACKQTERQRRKSYQFMLGDFPCWSVDDGGHTYSVASLFANVPREEAEQALRRLGQPADSVTTPYTHLVVNTGDHWVLADMGAGSFFDTTGRLPGNLKAAGIDPGQVDVVVITHAHPDHIGGVLDRAGNLAYPNAHYFIGRDEWAFWTSDLALEKWPHDWAMSVRENLKVMEDRLSLVEHEGEIVPGVAMLPAPGHTPGHMVVSVKSGGEELLYIGDAVLHTLQLEHPDWLPQPIFWLDPEEAAISQRRVFDYAADTGALVVGQHFIPFPSLGHVVRLGEGWQWQPETLV